MEHWWADDAIVSMAARYLRGEKLWGNTEAEFVKNTSMAMDVPKEVVLSSLRQAEINEQKMDEREYYV